MKRIFNFLKFILMMFFVVCGGFIIILICRESFWISVLLPVVFVEVVWLGAESAAYQFIDQEYQEVDKQQGKFD